jgi:orotate phosphoribosyltransferase
MQQIIELLAPRRGHFLFESGHHGDLWFDLESLCLDPRRARVIGAELAEPLSKMAIDLVCGPLVEGAFIGLMVALHLDVQFVYSERRARSIEGGLFPFGYRIPAALRPVLRGKRVALVNDVINAGSAIKGTFTDLQSCGAEVVEISASLVLGTAASKFADRVGVPLRSLAVLPNNLWTSTECPFCAAGTPLQDVAAFAALP